MKKGKGLLAGSLTILVTILGVSGALLGETLQDQNSSSTPSSSYSSTSSEFDYSAVPAYTDSPYIAVNNNVPYFTEKDYTTESYESYGELDSLGRCTSCIACVGQDLMPTEKRGSIGSVKPSGWQIAKYDFIDGKYLYNRCHLIGYQLSGENANERNLITGTRYLNVSGMLPFENLVGDYVKETGNHVLYRSTPIFVDDEWVARGVLLEGYSIEDNGEGVQFCVFCYNVQPGVTINYYDGSNQATT